MPYFDITTAPVSHLTHPRSVTARIRKPGLENRGSSHARRCRHSYTAAAKVATRHSPGRQCAAFLSHCGPTLLAITRTTPSLSRRIDRVKPPRTPSTECASSCKFPSRGSRKVAPMEKGRLSKVPPLLSYLDTGCRVLSWNVLVHYIMGSK